MSDPEESSVDAFAVLTDETRLSIIRELADRIGPTTADSACSFSQLRRAVGERDSGKFNYHLDKLVGRFIDKTDEGYVLNPMGVRIASTVISGQYDGGEIEATLDWPCPVCDTTVKATFRAGAVNVLCANDHGFSEFAPPGVFHDRSIEDAVDAVAAAGVRNVRQIQAGVCPYCFGPVEWSLNQSNAEADDDPAAVADGEPDTADGDTGTGTVANDDTNATNGDTNATNGDTNATNGDTNVTSGDADTMSGNTDTTSGDTNATSGDTTDQTDNAAASAGGGGVTTIGQCQQCGVPYGGEIGAFALMRPVVEHRLRQFGIDIWADPAKWLVRFTTVETGENVTTDADDVAIPIHATFDECVINGVTDERGQFREFEATGAEIN